jgi:hypothetical protein
MGKGGRGATSARARVARSPDEAAGVGAARVYERRGEDATRRAQEPPATARETQARSRLRGRGRDL